MRNCKKCKEPFTGPLHSLVEEIKILARMRDQADSKYQLGLSGELLLKEDLLRTTLNALPSFKAVGYHAYEEMDNLQYLEFKYECKELKDESNNNINCL